MSSQLIFVAPNSWNEAIRLFAKGNRTYTVALQESIFPAIRLHAHGLEHQNLWVLFLPDQ
jgi:hypothetical protein